MSVLKTVFYCIFLCFLTLDAQGQRKEHDFFSKERKEEESKELPPSEHFYQQRAYPDEELDLKAYLNAFQKAKNQDDARAGAQSGFDVPWSLVGPTNIRGRVNAIAIHPTNPDIQLLGFATGGVWKTTDGGKNWKSVFDQQSSISIGDIAYAPSNPNIVYVGTGDPNITGYPFIGTGLYKSIDGGESWTYSGLQETRIISKIVVHPTNPDIVYVGAMGLPFERNDDRGLYKSINGGSSWTKSFFFSNQAGVIDIAMNPQNPKQIFIAGWDRIRNNKESITNGPNCRIVKSNDEGTSWYNQTTGLPTGVNGRIGLAISPVSGSTVYASYTDANEDLKGIYKTITGGASWSNIVVNTSYTKQFLGGMGWYFGKIFVTATDVYVLGVDLWRSKDNGVTWDNLSESTEAHVDMHDLIIRGNTTYLASDAGAYKSLDDGLTWSSMEQIPSTAFYKVTTYPFAKDIYYGGAQDNGTLVGGKNTINNWLNIQRGDGFRTQFTKFDSRIVFTETQLGRIWVSKDSANTFQLATFGISGQDRVAWDSPYLVSKVNSSSMFAATDRVYKNNNLNNPSWNVWSGDLTNGQIFGPQFHVVTCLEESKQDSNKLYVGTSDGKLWTNSVAVPTLWKDISKDLPNRYVTSVQTSPTDSQTVFVTHSGYKDNVFTPHIHKSTNGGLTWQAINGNLPPFAVNDLFVLPKQKDSILVAATDGGIYASTNQGEFWQRLGKNMPYMPVYDIEWDEQNNLLVAATHGRAIMTYPIDSLLYKAPPLFSLSGNIKTYLTGKLVKNVIVTATFDNKKIAVISDTLGNFRFDNQIPKGVKVTITPSKKEKGSNGVSTADIIDLQKDILGTKKISNPTSIIAADVNKNTTISTSDIVAMRKVILGLLDTFPSGEGWRFVPQKYQFPDIQNPFKPLFPEKIVMNSVDSNRVDLDFYGIRLGDTNESAKPYLKATPNKGAEKAILRKETD